MSISELFESNYVRIYFLTINNYQDCLHMTAATPADAQTLCQIYKRSLFHLMEDEMEGDVCIVPVLKAANSTWREKHEQGGSSTDEEVRGTNKP